MLARWIRFLIAILVGIGLGLLYGWVIDPVQYTDTAPHTLRIDYKADYVLMVAEAYEYEHDPLLAQQRLSRLGDQPPGEIIAQALEFARKYGYNPADIARIERLWNALQSSTPPPHLITP